MSMFVSNEQAQDFLTQPVSGVEGLGYTTKTTLPIIFGKTTEMTFDETQTKTGNDSGEEEIDIAGLRASAQAKCPSAKISNITDAELTAHGQSVMTKYANLSLDEFLAKGQQIQDEILTTICNAAQAKSGGTQTSSSGFVMPKWGWPAIIVAAVIGGYFIFKGK